MAAVMMNWGGVIFHQSTRSFDRAKRSTDYNWATVDRMGPTRRPAKQYVGPGEDKVTLEGVIFGTYNPGGEYVGGRQLDELHERASEGSPYLLQDGNGLVWGMFCLVNIDEEGSIFIDTGAPRKQAYTLTFERYGIDGY